MRIGEKKLDLVEVFSRYNPRALANSGEASEVLEKLRVLESKVRNLESSEKDVTIIIGSEKFSSWKDILAKLNGVNTMVTQGGMFNPILMLEELSRILKDHALSHEDFAKYRNELSKADLTEEENAQEKSIQRAAPIPDIFGKSFGKGKKGSKSKSDLNGVTSYLEFRNKTDVAYEIHKYLADFLEARRYAIENCYGDSQMLFFRTLAMENLHKSEDFLCKLIFWVDTTFKNLVNRGQSEEDVWHLLSKILKGIFEDIHCSRRMINLETRASHEV
ncbi:predicted protein [Chaetoceros tenuissimus]|uniref:Uncharacterized protein n=1 Tax=Chaetoceros tenuissimus TaxID=426638 RepID=A0AAD3CN21_9STRA|nr:predicted protein [Chaetoceros tenuissimus]